MAAWLSPERARAVVIDWVTVGDAGNLADTSPAGFGAVNYEYRIGMYEVTIQQYAEFLNAVAESDPYELWHPNMETDLNVAGIARTGADGSFTYSVIGPSGVTPLGADSPGNRPITYVSWFDAARFANWLHNGQGTGSTETGAYTLSGAMFGPPPAKNSGAEYSIPTENEWYKAAYYKGGGTNAGYWDYAMQSNAALQSAFDPENLVGSGSNQANYRRTGTRFSVTQSGTYIAGQNYLTNVGAFRDSASAYGTFDQSGNVAEWLDTPGSNAWMHRGRGGSWEGDDNSLDANDRYAQYAYESYRNTGFRLASPALAALLVTGSQVFASPIRADCTVEAGANASFTSGFNGELTVAGGSATLGGPIEGIVSVASGAAVTIASGASLTGAKVSLAPGAILSVARGARVPIAAGNIGGITVSSAAGLAATVLSGSVATDVNIVGTFSPVGNFTAAGGGSIVGEVLSFEGTGDATWVLQMQYNPASWLDDEATLLAQGKLFLTWRDPTTNAWVNAVDGNTGGTKQLFQRAWQAGDELGSYGVDVVSNTAWAVINHNSDFAITAITAVPEPSAAALGVAGLAGVAWAAERRRRSASGGTGHGCRDPAECR